jgi:hypothetical protein
MIDFPYLIEPGTRAARKAVVDNFAAISDAASNIGADQIEDAAIEIRHIGAIGVFSEAWKSVTHYTEVAALTHTAMNSNSLIIPRTAPIETLRTFIGGPVIVYARVQVSGGSSGNAIMRPSIWVDGVRACLVDVEVGEDESHSVKLFHMFEATLTNHLVEVRADTAVTSCANVSVTQAQLEVISVRA